MKPAGWVALLVLVAACGRAAAPGSSGSAATRSSSASAAPSGQTTVDTAPEITQHIPLTSDSCPPVGELEGETVGVPEVAEVGGLRVDAAFYPLPGPEGSPWSQWGQGVVASGVFFSAVGDHRGADGNSYLYAYDPDRKTLTRFADVLSSTSHRVGDWGYGKIHAPMITWSCDLYAATYWGTRRGLRYGGSYRGDLLLRVDVSTGRVENLGSPVPERGFPSMVRSGDLLFMEGVEPFTDRGWLVVYDLSSRRTVDLVRAKGHDLFRSLLVDPQGRIHLSAGDRTLSYGSGGLRERLVLPGEGLRAAVTVGDVAVAVTNDPARLFSVDTTGRVVDLGPARGYTTSLAADPERRVVFWMPDAHGGAWRSGAPVYRLELDTGEVTKLVDLQPAVGERLGVRVGGSYNLVYDEDRRLLYVGLNTGDEDLSFGKPVLAVVAIP